MLHISKIDHYLIIFTEDEGEDFVVINFGEYFKSMKEKLCSKLNEEHNFRKVVESLYVFLTTTDEVEKYANVMQSHSSDNCKHAYNIEILNPFDPEMQLFNLWSKTN